MSFRSLLPLSLLLLLYLAACAPTKQGPSAPVVPAAGKTALPSAAPAAPGKPATLDATGREIEGHKAGLAAGAKAEPAKSALPVELDFLFKARPQALLPEDFDIGALGPYPSGDPDLDEVHALFRDFLRALEDGRPLDDYLAEGYGTEILRGITGRLAFPLRFARLGPMTGDSEERRFIFKLALQAGFVSGEAAARKTGKAWRLSDLLLESSGAPARTEKFDPESFLFEL